MRTMSFVLVGLALAAVGCDEKKPQLPPAAATPVPASAASSAAPPPVAGATKFGVDPGGKTNLVLTAPIETIKAATTAAGGALDLDLANLPASRGQVKVDLTTLTMSTFAEPAKNALQTTHARTWLEVADAESGPLDEKVKQANRWAVYDIRGVENASATDLAKVAPSKDGADDVRTVTLTTKGELLVHGAKVDRDADVKLDFRYDPGAPASKPREVSITTRKPFRVVLAEHDVKPRDDFGKIKKKAFELLGTKVADAAEISLDLRAKPQP